MKTTMKYSTDCTRHNVVWAEIQVREGDWPGDHIGKSTQSFLLYELATQSNGR